MIFLKNLSGIKYEQTNATLQGKLERLAAESEGRFQSARELVEKKL
jgi:hypothetical protein